MEVASKYTKVFTSDCITRQKYDELYELAISIREQKNTISKVIASDIFNYLDKNPLTLFIKKVCEWLMENMHDYFDEDNEFAVASDFITCDEFIENFKKAMDE